MVDLGSLVEPPYRNIVADTAKVASGLGNERFGISVSSVKRILRH
jgi:hypothetical protein